MWTENQAAWKSRGKKVEGDDSKEPNKLEDGNALKGIDKDEPLEWTKTDSSTKNGSVQIKLMENRS